MFIYKWMKLRSSIVFLIPNSHSTSIRIIFESINGIRSISNIPIKIIAPLNRAMPLWRGFTAEMFAGVDFIDAEPGGGTLTDIAVTSTYLLALMQRVRMDISADAPGNFYVFVGVETYADAFTECAFTLRRRLGAAAVFALDTRGENLDQRPVDSEWSTRPSLGSGATLLTFDARFEVRTTGQARMKVLADPRLGRVAMAARQHARREMNVSDGNFALAVVSDEASMTGTAQVAWQTALILALMQSPDSRLLITGRGDKTVAPWLADLSATFPGRMRFAGTCAYGAAGICAADLLLIPGGERGCSNALCCGENAATSEAAEAGHEHRIVVLEEDANKDAVADFVQAVSLLPAHASRGVELLRNSFVLSLRARMNLRFGRSLYHAMTQVR
jgi:hypothetical protein